MSAPNYKGAKPPPVPSEPEYDVVGLPATGHLDLLFLGDLVWGIDCHWVIPATGQSGHSALCTHYCGDCPHCGVHRKLWLGFAPVIDMARKKRIVFRMGPETCGAVAKYAGRLVSWHGLTARVSKVKGSRTSGALIEACPFSAPTPMPHPHAMARSIRRVLRCDNLPDFHLDADESIDRPVSDENGGV